MQVRKIMSDVTSIDLLTRELQKRTLLLVVIPLHRIFVLLHFLYNKVYFKDSKRILWCLLRI